MTVCNRYCVVGNCFWNTFHNEAEKEQYYVIVECIIAKCYVYNVCAKSTRLTLSNKYHYIAYLTHVLHRIFVMLN